MIHHVRELRSCVATSPSPTPLRAAENRMEPQPVIVDDNMLVGEIEGIGTKLTTRFRA